jgi:hypothetical protein
VLRWLPERNAAKALELEYRMSRTPNVYKPHAVPHQLNCRLAPWQRQAHPCCSRALRSNSEPLARRSCLCVKFGAPSISNDWPNTKLHQYTSESSAHSESHRPALDQGAKPRCQAYKLGPGIRARQKIGNPLHFWVPESRGEPTL